jgi:HPr kinase/phosphorylase
MNRFLVHGSCVALNGKGVLIRGKPGSGKSDLALRLIDQTGFGLGETLWRGQLVADDQVLLTKQEGEIIVNPPEALAGMLEIRGQGIVSLAFVGNVKLALIVDLVASTEIPRMPEPHDMATELHGVVLPRLFLDARQDSAAARIRSFLS